MIDKYRLPQPPGTGRQLVTVVVCTRNRAPLLARAVQSLGNQETHGEFDYEVLIINNGSTDATSAVIAGMEAMFPVPLRMAVEPVQGIVAARNRGVHEARGDWIAFLDDDEVADVSWLRELMHAARERGTLCVGGSVELELPAGSPHRIGPFCRRMLGSTQGRTAPRRFGSDFQPGTGNLLVHRSLWSDHGDFRGSGVPADRAQRGEDSRWFADLTARGLSAWFAPAARVRHVIPPERLTRAALLELARSSAFAADLTQSRWGRWLPLVALGRVHRLAMLRFPALITAACCRSNADFLDEECKFRLEIYRVLEELRLTVQSVDRRTPSNQPTIT